MAKGHITADRLQQKEKWRALSIVYEAVEESHITAVKVTRNHKIYEHKMHSLSTSRYMPFTPLHELQHPIPPTKPPNTKPSV